MSEPAVVEKLHPDGGAVRVGFTAVVPGAAPACRRPARLLRPTNHWPNKPAGSGSTFQLLLATVSPPQCGQE